MATVTTPRGLIDYTAANCFLDAFSGYFNFRAKTHTLTINWPGWKEVGMLADLEVLPNSGNVKEEELERAILTADGLNAFARLLNSDLRQVVVSPEGQPDLLRPVQASDGTGGIRVEQNHGASSQPGNGPSEEIDLPTNEVETTVAGIWAEVLGHGKIGVHQQFSTLGGHSLIAMQIVAKVRATYQIALSLREFFAAPTISQLSAEISAKILREIASLRDDEAARLVHAIRTDENP
jgi:acyl carrier protein